MRIYSWNMLHRNPRLERAFSFIRRLDFDVLCLQEVPENFLRQLQTLPYHLAYAVDMDRLYSDRLERNYLVLLSRHPIAGNDKFALGLPHLPLRTRLFVRAIKPYLKWSEVGNRHGFFVDIAPHGTSALFRIFCLHLILAHPEVRRQEFDIAMRAYDRRLPTIICGDFNILDSPLSTPFNWFLGGRPSDVFRFRRERQRFERIIEGHGLINPLRGKRTHVLRSQLDHILVSKDFFVTHSSVIPYRMGSDHHPVRVDVEVPQFAHLQKI